MPHVAVPDRHVCLAGKQRPHQPRDVAPVELPVSVDGDDHVGAGAKGGVQSRLEGRR